MGTQNGLTVAERDKIDQIINGMSREYQERALMNFEADLLCAEVTRRYDSYLESLKEIEKTFYKYQNKPLDLPTMRNQLKEFEAKVGAIKK